ncbi:NifU family protein [Pseudomonadota bacterium]
MNDKKEKKASSKNITNKIKKIIEKEISPMLKGDGGDIEFVDFQNGVVKVKLKGACIGCPMAGFTLKNMVEAILIDNIPEVLEVQKVEYESSKASDKNNSK